MKKIFYFLCLAVLVSVSALSCIPMDFKSTQAIEMVSVWENATLARQAVLGVYNSFYDRHSTTSGEDNWRVQDDAYSSVMDTDKNWYENQHNIYGDAMPSSVTFSSIFKFYYTFIFRANDVISHIDGVPDMEAGEKARLKAEARFLRAYAYYQLNVRWRGVPVYLEYIDDISKATRARSSELDVWYAIIEDLDACIAEPNLPGKYRAGDVDYGRVTKGAAYAYRGEAYLWLAARDAAQASSHYTQALSDFEAVESLGYALYTGAGANSFKQLFKPANEQCDEIIFSIQCTQQPGMGNPRAVLFGNRVTAVTSGAWNNYLPNPAWVESFEMADGSKFDWEDFCPGWHSMTPVERSVFFLRDNMTAAQRSKMTEYGSDMSRYLTTGNEARIRAAYDNRDPRLEMSVITPYAVYNGGISGVAYDFTLRWPYVLDAGDPYDIRTDTNSKYYYLWRKYVPEGLENTVRWVYEEDQILCRYAEILLRRAECLNELGRTGEAVTWVNKVRERAGHVLLNTSGFPATTVAGQDDMRERIRNEFYWELGGEFSMYFNELRWGVWYDRKFRDRSSGQWGAIGTNGLMQVWGETTYTWYSLGEYVEVWPIPAKEREMNPNLTQNPGWAD